MKLKIYLIPMILALTFSSTGWAIPKPDRCPSVDVIKYRGLLYAQKECGGITYAVPQFDKYGTNVAWGFAIENVTATDTDDAFNKGTELLKTLTGNPDPQLMRHGIWVCEYQVGNNEVVHAFTLDQEANSFITLPKFKK